MLVTLLLQVGASAQTPLPKEPPPAALPASIPVGSWHFWFAVQDIEGSLYKLSGLPGVPAEIESAKMVIRGDQIEYDSDTGDVRAQGHVYFRDFEKNEQIWASRMEYNTEEKRGRYWDVRGETHPRIVTRPGVLTVDAPFYFQGAWAEKIGLKYILHDGWITNCKLPGPWWRMRGPKFVIVPHEYAIAYRSVFILKKFPLFYAPFFYHSLAKEPRKSGFLIPNLVPHSQRGFMIGLGYYWAISRSYDATYRFQDFTTNAFSHHLDVRGNPRQGTDFNAILYGVQDRGDPNLGPNSPTYSGASIYVVGKTNLGDGWTARGYLNYVSSFRFRQNWAESLADVVGSEIHSVGFLSKDWSNYDFTLTFARLENFQSSELPFTDPVTQQTNLLSNAVTIRKLPEAELIGRDHQIWKNVPLWFSFGATAGLLNRSEPIFDSNNKLIDRFATGQFMNRENVAPTLTGALHWGSFHLIPSIGVQETYYSEAQTADPLGTGLTHVTGTNLVRSARQLGLDLVFPMLERIYTKKTVFGDKLKHVIEPRATYRYVTGIGADFDRFIRFDEMDLLSNTNELELSLTNRLFAKRGDSVQEIFTWELLQKRYFDPTFGGALTAGDPTLFDSTSSLSAYAFRVGPRSASPVVSLLRTNPVGGLGVQWQTDYDPRLHTVMDSALSVDYHFWNRYFVLIGNNQVSSSPAQVTSAANQYQFRAGYGDANRKGLNLGFDVHYDVRQAQVQYATTQVTYNTDCCGISVQYRLNDLVVPARSEWRIAFAVGNIGTLGTLRKQDRLF